MSLNVAVIARPRLDSRETYYAWISLSPFVEHRPLLTVCTIRIYIYIYTHIHIYFLHGSDRRYRLPFRLRTRSRFYFLFLPSRERKVYRWYSIPDSILESCVLRINVNHNLRIQSYESSKCMQPFIPRIEKETNPKKMNERGKTRLAKNLLRR